MSNSPLTTRSVQEDLMQAMDQMISQHTLKPPSVVVAANNAAKAEAAADAYITSIEGLLTARERGAITATYVVPFKRHGAMGDRPYYLLPGYGMFSAETAFDPNDMGTLDNFPQRVEVLTPAGFYPPMQYAAQRALAMRCEVQQLQKHVRNMESMGSSYGQNTTSLTTQMSLTKQMQQMQQRLDPLRYDFADVMQAAPPSGTFDSLRNIFGRKK